MLSEYASVSLLFCISWSVIIKYCDNWNGDELGYDTILNDRP